jgi:hypothetical protein
MLVYWHEVAFGDTTNVAEGVRVAHMLELEADTVLLAEIPLVDVDEPDDTVDNADIPDDAVEDADAPVDTLEDTVEDKIDDDTVDNAEELVEDVETAAI